MQIIAIKNVAASIIMVTCTPNLAIIIPAAPVPTRETALDKLSLRLNARERFSFFTTIGTNAPDAGRLNDSIVVISSVNPAMIKGLTLPNM